jgi:hypothetical protein
MFRQRKGQGFFLQPVETYLGIFSPDGFLADPPSMLQPHILTPDSRVQ